MIWPDDTYDEPAKDNETCLSVGTLLPSEHGALSMIQRLGNYLICGLIAVFWSKKFSDIGPFRAITWKALRSLTMKDSNLGWTFEMQIKAIKNGLTIIEVPVEYKCRQGGQSMVSGNLQTSIYAGAKMFFIIGQQLLTRQIPCLPNNERNGVNHD